MKDATQIELPTWAVVGTKLEPMRDSARMIFGRYKPYDLFVDYVDSRKIVIAVCEKGTKKLQGREQLLLKMFNKPNGWTANDFYGL